MDFEELVEQGVYTFAGTDDDGERLWAINMERAKEIAPDIYWFHQNELDKAILKALDMGLLELDIDSNTLEETYTVTEDGKNTL